MIFIATGLQDWTSKGKNENDSLAKMDVDTQRFLHILGYGVKSSLAATLILESPLLHRTISIKACSRGPPCKICSKVLESLLYHMIDATPVQNCCFNGLKLEIIKNVCTSEFI